MCLFLIQTSSHNLTRFRKLSFKYPLFLTFSIQTMTSFREPNSKIAALYNLFFFEIENVASILIRNHAGFLEKRKKRKLRGFFGASWPKTWFFECKLPLKIKQFRKVVLEIQQDVNCLIPNLTHCENFYIQLWNVVIFLIQKPGFWKSREKAKYVVLFEI